MTFTLSIDELTVLADNSLTIKFLSDLPLKVNDAFQVESATIKITSIHMQGSGIYYTAVADKSVPGINGEQLKGVFNNLNYKQVTVIEPATTA